MRKMDFDAAREILATLRIGGKEYKIMEPLLEQVMQVEQMRLSKTVQLNKLNEEKKFSEMSKLEWDMIAEELSILIEGLPAKVVFKMTARQRKDLLDLLNSTETKGDGGDSVPPPDSQE